MTEQELAVASMKLDANRLATQLRDARVLTARREAQLAGLLVAIRVIDKTWAPTADVVPDPPKK